MIQSVPSPKAEPFKLWLAKVGYERVEENDDPEKTIDRAMATYLAKGYTKEWINQLGSLQIGNVGCLLNKFRNNHDYSISLSAAASLIQSSHIFGVSRLILPMRPSLKSWITISAALWRFIVPPDIMQPRLLPMVSRIASSGAEI